MNHCKNCKYWELGSCYDRPKEVRRCSYPKQLWESTTWVKLEGTERPAVEYRLINDNLAYVKDTSDYQVDLYTRAEFGCVAFVEKGND